MYMDIAYKPMSELRRLHNDAGGFFFSRGAMKGFRSIVYDHVYTGATGWYFVTSERSDSSPRYYSVRRMDANSHDILTVRDHSYPKKSKAVEAAKMLAAQEKERYEDPRCGRCGRELTAEHVHNEDLTFYDYKLRYDVHFCSQECMSAYIEDWTPD